jgi:hypothetical protein
MPFAWINALAQPVEALAEAREASARGGAVMDPTSSHLPCEGSYPPRDLPLDGHPFIVLSLRRILLVEPWSLS